MRTVPQLKALASILSSSTRFRRENGASSSKETRLQTFSSVNVFLCDMFSASLLLTNMPIYRPLTESNSRQRVWTAKREV